MALSKSGEGEGRGEGGAGMDEKEEKGEAISSTLSIETKSDAPDGQIPIPYSPDDEMAHTVEGVIAERKAWRDEMFARVGLTPTAATGAEEVGGGLDEKPKPQNCKSTADLKSVDWLNPRFDDATHAPHILESHSKKNKHATFKVRLSDNARVLMPPGAMGVYSKRRIDANTDWKKRTTTATAGKGVNTDWKRKAGTFIGTQGDGLLGGKHRHTGHAGQHTNVGMAAMQMHAAKNVNSAQKKNEVGQKLEGVSKATQKLLGVESHYQLGIRKVHSFNGTDHVADTPSRAASPGPKRVPSVASNGPGDEVWEVDAETAMNSRRNLMEGLQDQQGDVAVDVKADEGARPRGKTLGDGLPPRVEPEGIRRTQTIGATAMTRRELGVACGVGYLGGVGGVGWVGGGVRERICCANPYPVLLTPSLSLYRRAAGVFPSWIHRV